LDGGGRGHGHCRRLYDEQGAIGLAVQTLVLREGVRQRPGPRSGALRVHDGRWLAAARARGGLLGPGGLGGRGIETSAGGTATGELHRGGRRAGLARPRPRRGRPVPASAVDRAPGSAGRERAVWPGASSGLPSSNGVRATAKVRAGSVQLASARSHVGSGCARRDLEAEAGWHPLSKRALGREGLCPPPSGMDWPANRQPG